MTDHPLLDELDDGQRELVRLLGRPWTIPEVADARGWPVWDFVERAYRRSRPSVTAADVLTALPSLTVGGRPYGLWWRSDHNMTSLSGGERVGLSLVGLYHLMPLLNGVVGAANPLNICLSLVRDATLREEELDANDDWTEAATAQIDLRADRFGQVPGHLDPPVELLGQVLMREFIPLVRPTSNFNYSVDVGGGRFAPFRGVKTIADYIAVAERLSEQPEDLRATAPSPIALPAAIDYLGLVLDRDTRWVVTGATVTIPSVADAALIGQPPESHAGFNQRVSVTWNLLSQLRTPKGPAEAYERRGWDASTSGSLNNLDIWLADSLDAAETGTPIATLRALGRIRQSAQHANQHTQRGRDEALTTFGVAWPVTEWATAWAKVSDRCAGALYDIAQSVRRSQA